MLFKIQVFDCGIENSILKILDKLGVTLPENNAPKEKLESLLVGILNKYLFELNVKELEDDCFGVYFDPTDAVCKDCADSKKCRNEFVKYMEDTADKILDTMLTEESSCALDSFSHEELDKIFRSNIRMKKLVDSVSIFDPVSRLKILIIDENIASQGSFSYLILKKFKDYEGSILTFDEFRKIVSTVIKEKLLELTVEEEIIIVQSILRLFKGVFKILEV